MTHKRNIVFISHGGGPMPLLGDPNHKEMVDTLKTIKNKIDKTSGKPSAILVISAHWEARQPSITSASAPSLIYDYNGFPEKPTKSNTQVLVSLNWQNAFMNH